jgi:hypothetical protein
MTWWRGVADAGDVKARPFGSEVLTPGGTSLDNGQMAGRDFTLDTDLVAGVLRHACGAPPMHSGHVQFG